LLHFFYWLPHSPPSPNQPTSIQSHNYSILSENDLSQRAAFVVVGKLVQYTDTVSLAPSGTGCAMKATLLEVGSDNADWRQFHHRLAQALAKLQAAKPKPDEPAPAQP